MCYGCCMWVGVCMYVYIYTEYVCMNVYVGWWVCVCMCIIYTCTNVWCIHHTLYVYVLCVYVCMYVGVLCKFEN